MLKKLEDDKAGMITGALKEMATSAMENPAIKDAVIKKVAWLAGRSSAKAIIGAFGVVTGGLVTAAAAASTLVDLIQTTREIAALMGSEGKIMLDAIDQMMDVNKKAAEIVQDMKENPEKAHSNMQELMARVNPCTKARKCLLVPYRRTKSSASQARNGTGCCPGQTGHHVIPDSMVKDAGCTDYKYGDAPVICLEGSSHHEGWGSHGTAHQTLATSMKKYRDTAAKPNEISYQDAKKHCIDAIEEAGASHCNRACFEAQLDEHYKCDGKMLKPADGTGPFKPVVDNPASDEQDE